MRVLISGGGTGGHVYPALAVVEQLDRAAGEPLPGAAANGEAAQRAQPGAVAALRKVEDSHRFSADEVLWIGSSDGMEAELVARAGIVYRGIDTGQLRGINPMRAAANVGRMLSGIRQSRAIIGSYAPDVCFVTGGYVCAPVVIASRMMSIPVLIYLPDVTPGWAIQRLSKFATRVAVSLPAAAVWFGGEAPDGKAVVTGYPVRQQLIDAAADRTGSRGQLAESLALPLAGPKPLTLIWGGSQGSRSINQATWAALPALLPHGHILHVVGHRDWQLLEQNRIIESLPEEVRGRYHPLAYLHDEMPLALAAADLTVARAGASSLGEFPVAGLPAILVPLPFGGVNQAQNAEQLARTGAAVIVEDERLDDELADTLIELLQDNLKREAMAAAARAQARPEAALNIARQLHLLAHSHAGNAGSENWT